MSRPIALLITHSRLFPAHWALWIPSPSNLTTNSNKGRYIHVTGSVAEGFTHEFVRGFDLQRDMVGSREGGSWSVLDLGVVDAGMLEGGDDAGSGEEGERRDCVASDGLERRALSLEAPGKSLGVLDGRGRKMKVELRNCQTWLREFVGVLVKDGVLSGDALVVLDGAPKN